MHIQAGSSSFRMKKNFCVDPVRNSHNDWYIHLKDSEVDEDVFTAAKFITKTEHPALLMFLGAVASMSEASLPIWFPTGFHLSTSTTRKLHKKTLILWMKEVAQKHNKDFIFQQDGTPAHTARSTQACLREADIDFLQKNMWPPSSPDLIPREKNRGILRAWHAQNDTAV